ncbi:MAG: PhzF family phenazine biosynthesis protein [Candidatus Eremiobacteraeota bacterium]|nr:PhzF family phenazine biosynthesis protein [Candidatus Eremiobacteraeota bacterium]
MKWTYDVVDVFTQTPLEGNPLAVFPDARGLDASTMQRIARELNLSETAFVLPPSLRGAAARVRIFTPGKEMLFAGHPTIGTAFVIRERGIVDRNLSRFTLEEKVGAVPLRIDDGSQPMIWLMTPPITFGPAFERDLAASALGLISADLLPGVPCRLATAGNPVIFIAVTDKDAVDRAALDTIPFRKLVASQPEPTCVFVFAPTPAGAYSRNFAPDLGVAEDPATGSATGPLAAFMMRHGLVPTLDGTRFVSEQGTKMGRRSLLHVYLRGEAGSEAIEVGGHVVRVATAVLELDVDSGIAAA